MRATSTESASARKVHGFAPAGPSPERASKIALNHTPARTGVAWTVGEFSEEITGVAAPVCDGDGETVASVTVYGPDFRFPGDADTCEIERLVVETAKRVAALLGD